jgi:hypothetical protein
MGRGHRGVRAAGRGNAGKDGVSAGKGAAPRPDHAMAGERRGTRQGGAGRRGHVPCWTERHRAQGGAGADAPRGEGGLGHAGAAG